MFFSTLMTILQQNDPSAFLGFLLLAYAVMWVIGAVYVGSLAVQQRNIRRDIALLKQILMEDNPDG